MQVEYQGSISDSGVFNHTSFGKALLNKKLTIPDPEPLPGRYDSSPYVVVADDAFPFRENILKPYSTDLRKGSTKRVFNL